MSRSDEGRLVLKFKCHIQMYLELNYNSGPYRDGDRIKLQIKPLFMIAHMHNVQQLMVLKNTTRYVKITEKCCKNSPPSSFRSAQCVIHIALQPRERLIDNGEDENVSCILEKGKKVLYKYRFETVPSKLQIMKIMLFQVDLQTH